MSNNTKVLEKLVDKLDENTEVLHEIHTWIEADKAQALNTPQIMSPDDRKLLERVAEAYEQANRKAISS